MRQLLVTVLALTTWLAGSSARGESGALAEAGQRSGALRVFLDCDRGCDFDFLRREIVYVNYVRDRHDAQVHVLVTNQRAAAGRELTLNFLGQESFAGVNQKLTVTTSDTDTSDEERRALLLVLQMGLMRYVSETPLARGLVISYHEPDGQPGAESAPGAANDPWRAWVYRARASAGFSGEDRRDRQSASGSFSARRTTPKWRTALGIDGDFSETTFEFDDGTSFVSTVRGSGAGAQLVRSLGPHWGAGLGASSRQSTFLNLDPSYRVAAAAEYNIYPYSESSERELKFSYFLGMTRFQFAEETLLGVTADTLTDQGVIGSFALKQPWGETGIGIELSHFVADPKLYRITLGGRLEYRVFRGLSIELSGNTALVRDQIYLPSAEASEEDILLGRRSLPTNSRFSLNMSLTYTFGSIFNNVVNSRFSGSSGGFHRIL